jgi:cysteine desulfurase / selenocysteine lyase
MDLNLASIREEFLPLARKVNGKTPIYLDNACMTLKPRAVLKEMQSYYENHPSCHNRAQHSFGLETTKLVREARATIARQLGAKTAEEIVFTRNTTEALNLVARGLRLRQGDVVLTTDFEHNSNLLPWQFLARREGIVHRTVAISPQDGTIDLIEFENALASNPVKLVSVFHTSHVTGITLPIREMAQIAHRHGALIMVDAAQALGHGPLNAGELDVDFLAVSFHKAFGPTGMGALYGKSQALRLLEPVYAGGETVLDTDYDTCVLAEVPERFEAGLQNYAGVLGAAAAMSYLGSLDPVLIKRHILSLNATLTEELRDCTRVRLLGPSAAEGRGAIFNFVFESMAAPELAVLLDQSHAIMARSGAHCCHAWFRKNELPASLRLSFSIYNTVEEVRTVAGAVRDLARFF